MERLPSSVIVVAVVAALAAWPARADAQIYSWRDANGNLVLSDKHPADQPVTTFEVPGSHTVRSTRPTVQRTDRRLEDIIEQHASANQLRPELVRAVIQTESAFDAHARSPKGAMGLMQLMPETAADYGVQNAYDPEENVRGGTAYLRDLIDRYEGSEELALAAYNAGPTAVDRYGQRVPPYRETQTYLKRVRAATSLAAAPKRRIYMTTVTIDGREVVKYTNVKPTPDAKELVAARRR
jgi:hypothetical protein